MLLHMFSPSSNNNDHRPVEGSSMLTLIKAPGKRKRKERTDFGHGDEHSNKYPRRPGRPRKDISTQLQRPVMSSSKRSDQTKPTSLKSLTAKRMITTFERLPTELLEKIFFYSLNFNLPRSSPVMGVRLSNQHIYLTTAMAVFEPTWRHTYELSIGSEDMALDPQSQQDVPGDPDLQAALLRCRWATVSVLRQAEKTWLSNVAPQSRTEPIQNVVNDRHYPSINQYVESGYNTLQTKTPLDTGCDPFDTDYIAFLQSTQVTDEESEAILTRPPFQWPSSLRIHPKTEIPESLLRGPWSEDMAMHLFWLVRAGAGIDYSASTNGEVARHGLDQAISDSNLQILYLLSCLGIESIVQEDILETAVNTCTMNRQAVMIRVLDILESKTPDDNSRWDRWFDDILDFALQQSGNKEEKRAQRIWWERLLKCWQRIPRRALEAQMERA